MTRKRFSSENIDPAGMGQMELGTATANSPFFSVGSGCSALCKAADTSSDTIQCQGS